MTRAPQTGLDPQKIFVHASTFHKSYELLRNSVLPKDGSSPDDQKVALIAHPSMVLSVFASELYLKCLLCVETSKVPAVHDLEKLFMGLPVKTRHEIDDLWDTDIRQPGKQAVLDKLRETPTGKEIKNDLRYALGKGADAFMELRYFYETEQSFFLLSDFPYVLRVAILRRFPHWGEILPKPAKGLVR